MPDAPAPRYNTLGEPVGSWTFTIEYHESTDQVIVRGSTPGGRWHRPGRHVRLFAADEIEEALAHLARLVRTNGAHRLF